MGSLIEGERVRESRVRGVSIRIRGSSVRVLVSDYEVSISEFTCQSVTIGMFARHRYQYQYV